MMTNVVPMTSKHGKKVSVAIPTAYYEQLKAYAEQHGITLREAVERAITVLLGA